VGMIFIALLAWQLEIEALGNLKLRVLSLPGAVLSGEDERLLGPTLRQPGFAQLLARAQALTVRVDAGGLTRGYVLLNEPMIALTGNDRAQLIAHEFGHQWLTAKGFPPPDYFPGSQGCLAVHAGDIVQHILLRRELDRRGFDWRSSYARDYQKAYLQSGSQSGLRSGLQSGLQSGIVARGDVCFRAQRLSLMMDIRTGFVPGAFNGRNEYLAWLGAQDKEAEAIAVELEESLQDLPFLVAPYNEALTRVRKLLELSQ